MPYNKQNSRVVRFQCDTVFDASGTATAVAAQAFLQSRLVNDSDPNDAVDTPWTPVAFNLLDPALAGETITAAGKNVSYPQLAALLRQAALDRANA